MTQSRETRITQAVSKAETAFWREIAAAFPEITSGDMDAITHLGRESDNLALVTDWVEENAPKPFVQSVIVTFNTGASFEITQGAENPNNNGVSYDQNPISTIEGAADLEDGIYTLLDQIGLVPKRKIKHEFEAPPCNMTHMGLSDTDACTERRVSGPCRISGCGQLIGDHK